MKTILPFLVFSIFIEVNGISQNVNIPDNNFLQKLLDSGIDANHDGLIQTSEAEIVTALDVSNLNISDLKGIEAFINLDSLNCSSNQLTSLDISQNTKLTSLFCIINKLTSLDISKNLNLEKLFCSHNKLSALEILNNSELTMLDCSYNNLAGINLSSNTKLEILECYSNKLDSLNVKANSKLSVMYCDNNIIKSLNLSGNPDLVTLVCSYNKLETINLTKNTKLKVMACYSNLLTNLDVTNDTSLTSLDCGGNLFTSLDVSKNIQLAVLDCGGTPSLQYICVADTNVAKTTPGFYKDVSTQWKQDCSEPSAVKEYIKTDLFNIFPNPSGDYFYLRLQMPGAIRVMNSTGLLIHKYDNIQNLKFGHNFLPGMYFIIITYPGKDNYRVFKIIKE